ncbi:MAG TPA: MBL fold metallo-hydrolase [Anaerolineae bacterium]|nr:MBL fold metallo-hydrolase [Anaerolineae bacterium]
METVHPHLKRIELGNVNAFLWTGEGGPTLIDTGYPWTFAQLIDQLNAAGIQPADLQRIIITHADLDHIGGLKGLTELSDAAIACHTVEAIYVTGGQLKPFRGVKGKLMTIPVRVAERVYKPRVAQVQELLLEKETTPEGFTIWHTPGHSPGHIVLHHKEAGLLILGDALVYINGKLDLPPRVFTPNMEQAIESLAKLKKLQFETACFGHGPCITESADATIHAFIDKLAGGERG